MRTIGITGGVGAGKTKVLNYIKENYECEIVYADELAKNLFKKGQALYIPLVDLLTDSVLSEDGEIDRKKMSSMIFTDEGLREQVNAMIHPAVKEWIINRMCELKKKENCELFFLEAALLIEEGYDSILDEIWYVYADEDVRIDRLEKTRGYSEKKARSIIKSQLKDRIFRKHADFIIDNSGDFSDCIKSIKERLSNG